MELSICESAARHLKTRTLTCLLSEEEEECKWRHEEVALEHRLSAAIVVGEVNLVADILKSGLDTNISDDLFGQPLQLAARTNHISIIKLLMDTGADIHGINDRYTRIGDDEYEIGYGQPIALDTGVGSWSCAIGPLERAAAIGNQKAIDLLYNSSTRFGVASFSKAELMIAAEAACSNGHCTLLFYLLELAGCKLSLSGYPWHHITEEQHSLLLKEACFHGRADIVRVFLKPVDDDCSLESLLR